MQLTGVTWTGPATDDPEILDRTPRGLARLLEATGGFILHGGALHLRGACRGPDWHSLRAAWEGEAAIHRLWPAVPPEAIPFAEDCVGDQFLLLDGAVLRLSAETGELSPMAPAFEPFLEGACADPLGYLDAEPLAALVRERNDPGALAPGQLISVWPPFCTEQSAEGVSLRAVESLQRRRFLADFAAALDDG